LSCPDFAILQFCSANEHFDAMKNLCNNCVRFSTTIVCVFFVAPQLGVRVFCWLKLCEYVFVQQLRVGVLVAQQLCVGVLNIVFG